MTLINFSQVLVHMGQALPDIGTMGAHIYIYIKLVGI